MKTVLLRGISAVLLCAVLLLAFSSCAAKMTDDEAIAILQALLPRAQVLNVVFFGEGLPTTDDSLLETVENAQYRTVAPGAAFTSIAAIRAEAEQVFTRAYLQNSVYPMAFVGVDDRAPRYREANGVLYFNKLSNCFDLNGSIDPASARVTARGIDSVDVKVVYRRDDYTVTATLTLRAQDGVWLLDTPTY